MSNIVVARVLTFAVLLASATSPAVADEQLTCANHREKLELLAQRAGIKSRDWNRNHEQVAYSICQGDSKSVDGVVDAGLVAGREAQAIAKALGKAYTAKPRTRAGISYAAARKRFSDMGCCSACADNIAQYYTKKPDSACGKLASRALAGDAGAVRQLVDDDPEYCHWRY